MVVETTPTPAPVPLVSLRSRMPTAERSIRVPILTVRVPLALTAAIAVVDAGLLTWLNTADRIPWLAWAFAGPSAVDNLVIFWTLFIVVVVGMMFGLGHLRPRDVGLDRRGIGTAVVVTLLVWIAIQLVAAATAAATGAPVTIHPSWRQYGAFRVLLWTFGMLAGTAFVEEVVFRGFLLTQLAVALPGSRGIRLWSALVLSQIVFGVSHAASLMRGGMSGEALLLQLGLLTIAGLILALLYLRTRNLWLTMGMHCLVDAPTTLIVGARTIDLFIIGLVIVWPWIARRPENRGLATIVSRGDADESSQAFDGFRGAAPELEPSSLGHVR